MNNERQFIDDARYATGRLRSKNELPLQNPVAGRGPGALGIPDDVYRREPGDGLPTVARLLIEAQAEEEARVAAILSAVA